MICPNCNQEYEGNRCPNCGRPAFSTVNRILAVVVAVCLIAPFAFFGACSAFFAVSTMASGGAEGFGFGATMLAFAALGLGAAYGFYVLARNLWK